MIFNQNRAIELLRLGSGIPNANFREGQEEAIRHIVEGRGRLLVVQRTGWGKSFVYFIATKLLREAGEGPALLISPLLALMRNQKAAARRMGVRALEITSENQDKWPEVEGAVQRNEVDILLISPERLANEHFRTEVLAVIAQRISLLVIDEAHCISDWGHDFRPHYRLLERIVGTLPPNLRLLATTATANNRVMDDLQAVLGPELEVSRGELNRPSLVLQTMHLPKQEERLAWLAQHVPALTGAGIIYTLTKRDAEQVAAWLQSRGVNVASYTSQTGESRPELEDALLKNQVKCLVATPALGMGYDKPDLSFVIHYQTPSSVVTYYQQVGRAGRAIPSAYGVLFSGDEDQEINDYFINSAFPTPTEVNTILEELESAPRGLSINEMMARVNISYGRIDKATLLLSLESPAPIVKQGSKWQLTTTNLSDTFWKRAERLTALRIDEQNQMQEYVNLKSGHMEFLIQALDGDPSTVSQSPLPFLPSYADPALVREAVTFLRRTNLEIEPRRRWPVGGMPLYNLTGRISDDLLAQSGKALCIWGDAGWGTLVRHGKYQANHFSNELVEVCVNLIREWDPQPAPMWVTCIPSLRHHSIVSDFAQRLANSLNLPFNEVLDKIAHRPEQKLMANSIQQARNVDGSLEVNTNTLPASPVLLVDDMVDSGWTLTVGAWLLRSHGSGEVFPLALALT